jgi:purine-binding chemotaxis protein CheW
MSVVQYVLFALRDQIYGVEISKIKEVMSYRKITPLPNMKGFIKGIINLRGIIIPVFELKMKFDLSVDPYTPFHVIVVMEIAGRIMGIIADEISDVVELSPQNVQSTTNLPPGLQAQYILGIGKRGDELIILLNVDHILSQDELDSLDAT